MIYKDSEEVENLSEKEGCICQERYEKVIRPRLSGARKEVNFTKAEQNGV